MIIIKANPKDAGTYTLCIKNIIGIAYSSSNVFVANQLNNDIEMTFDSEARKPIVLSPLKDITTTEGKSVQLDCVISSLPEPGSSFIFAYFS